MESSQGRNIERRHFFVVTRKPIAELKNKNQTPEKYTALATARASLATV